MEKEAKLVVHAGGRKVSLAELGACRVPESLGPRHCPVPHLALVELLREQAERAGLKVAKEEHALTQGNSTYFGVFDLSEGGDWGISLGLRNNHSRRFSAALAYGQRVFVCDNLAFSGEHKVFRRHTREILRDMGLEMGEALSQVENVREKMNKRVAAYSARELVAPEMARLCSELVKREAIPERAWPKIFLEWGGHRLATGAAGDPSAWGFYNAVTQVLTPRGEAAVLPRYAEKAAEFTEVFDKFVELS